MMRDAIGQTYVVRVGAMQAQAEMGLVERHERGVGMVARFLRLLRTCRFLEAFWTTAGRAWRC